MGSDWTGGPAKWAAGGALGCASVFGIAWTVMNGAPAAAPAVAQRESLPESRPVAAAQSPAVSAPPESSPPPPPARHPAPAKPTHTVNLNTAGQAELELLPGI